MFTAKYRTALSKFETASTFKIYFSILYFVFGAFTADLLVLKLLIIQLLIKYGFYVPSAWSLRYGKRAFVRFFDVHSAS